jgi:uncharacterized protein (DUF2267 family)
MNKPEFVKRVQQLTNLPDTETAEDGTVIVLSMLSHRLTPEESKDVEAQLSRDLKNVWNSDTWIMNFLSLSRQFQLRYRRKEELYSLIDNEIDKQQLPIGAEQLAMAVFHVLKEQITPGEIDDIAAQLPTDIEQVWMAA